MGNLTEYQYIWMLYLLGATGATLATWLLFRGLGRALVHFFVISVAVILFTPYAVDAETMTMAPALFSLAFGVLDGGLSGIKPVLKLMLGLWGSTLIISLIYQLLTRNRGTAPKARARNERRPAQRNTVYQQEDDLPAYTPSRRAPQAGSGLSREERQARDELLREEPIRAVR